MEFIEEKWRQLTSFSNKEDEKSAYLNEIILAYSAPGRTYHNLQHVVSLFNLCEEYLPEIKNPVVVGFAILYHDVVYNTALRDNESASAEKAVKHLQALQLKKSFINDVESFIHATKDHELVDGIADASDLAYFLDFDLAILGSPADVYDAYSKSIRQEYLQYRSYVYKEGRKQALVQLLTKEHLYFTDAFQQKFEQQARENINNEIAQL
jgi:predicted metal-dependent HD superfamily phosphohydrolase